METIGNGQNIETLFRDLRLDVEREVPRFAAVWSAAESQPSTRTGLNLSFVTAVVAIVVCLSSFAFWLVRHQAGSQHSTANVIVTGSTPVSPAPMSIAPGRTPVMPISKANHASERKRHLRVAPRKCAITGGKEEFEIANTIAVSTWQSPTALLMQSPSDDLLVVLPQFHQSVVELETFLSETQQ